MRRGFTIIELLVTVAIIAILSSVVAAGVTTSRAKARDTQRVSDIKQLVNALQLYQNDMRVYPATLAPLAPDYIRVIPADPSGGAYLYAALVRGGSCNDFHIGAALETWGAGQGPLGNDFDAASAGAICPGSAANFSGDDPVYDLRP